MPPAVEQGLYRIAQEALNNSLKHAQAHKIIIRLTQQGTRLLLEISDDGRGFTPAEVRKQGGLGLRGIQERAEQLGAQLSIQSAPGHGARIQVEVDLSITHKSCTLAENHVPGGRHILKSLPSTPDRGNAWFAI
jgi:signal transduction histidine kinase